MPQEGAGLRACESNGGAHTPGPRRDAGSEVELTAELEESRVDDGQRRQPRGRGGSNESPGAVLSQIAIGIQRVRQIEVDRDPVTIPLAHAEDLREAKIQLVHVLGVVRSGLEQV